MDYEGFLKQKDYVLESSGFDIDKSELNPILFDFQKDIVRWALKKGKACIFAECGCGKSLMQLSWAHQINIHTGKKILILTPLAVAEQTKREADKFGYTAKVVEKQEECIAGINITNYEKLDKFDDLVYTTGEISIHPNVHTVIPDECVMSLDARHVDDKVIDEVKNILNNLPSTVEGCKVSTKLEWDRKTTYFHKTLVGYVEGACKELGYNYQFINSGAGHDAQFAAYMLPTTMIFVPSKDGRSHCDEEYSDIEHCYKACNVLLNAVLRTDEEGV